MFPKTKFMMTTMIAAQALAGLARADGPPADVLAARVSTLETAVKSLLASRVPVGTILPYAGGTLPARFLAADGKIVDEQRDTSGVYANLCALIRDLYRQPGDPAGICRLPDLRGRAPFGDGQGQGLTNRLLGEQGGAETHVLTVDEMPAHNHGGVTGTDYPDHQHGYDKALGGVWIGASQGNIVSMGVGGVSYGKPLSDGATTRHQHGIPAQGGGAPHSIMPPALVVKYMVKY